MRKSNLYLAALVAVFAMNMSAAKAEVCTDGTIIRHENYYGLAKAREECDRKHGGTAYTCEDGKQCVPAGGPIIPGKQYYTKSRPPGSGRIGPVKQWGT